MIPSSVPGAAPTENMLAYSWWNMLVPLLSGAGLLLLARVRLSELPADVMSRLKTASSAVSAAAGTAASAAAVKPDKPAAYARLIRQTPLDEVPREIALTRGECVIGRGEECDIVIPHTSISREHARLKKLTPGFVLFDLKSKNGTFVNGRKVVENLLKEGMTVKIGDIEFVFYDANPSA
jgi:pSer/pThr/pTyr-binding forkhead associated (FHA) protein